jgi:hypothetical protein
MSRWERGYGALALLIGLGVAAGCESGDLVAGPDGTPGAPRELAASYYAGAVHLSWLLPTRWDGESFRIYSKRTSDPDYFLIAEVTNCSAGACSYTDVNVAENVTYVYYVSAFAQRSGAESASPTAVEVLVPQRTPPPVPDQPGVVALDGANYVRWGTNARSASDFAYYRVWLVAQGDPFLLGETDSEGFLDLLADNGQTYSYFVSSVDELGHESQGSQRVSGTPRPDYTAERVYDYFDQPAASGFRFQQSETSDPVVSGTSASRHFRLEVDSDGWWLVPGPNTAVYPNGFLTTSLKCGPASDGDCQSLDQAPASGYEARDLGLAPQTTYVMRVRGDDGQNHYAAIRVQLLGSDGSGRDLMIFDWAYQLQPGNLNLAPERAPSP